MVKAGGGTPHGCGGRRAEPASWRRLWWRWCMAGRGWTLGWPSCAA